MNELPGLLRDRLDEVARWRYLILTAWCAFLWRRWVVQADGDFTGGDWMFLVGGFRLLLGLPDAGFGGPGGLSLYAAHPEFQIGPAAFLLAGPFTFLPDTGRLAACTVMAFASVAAAWACERAALAVRRARSARDVPGLPCGVLLGGLVMVGMWNDAAAIGHLDDIVVFTAMPASVWAVSRGRWRLAATIVALAVASKPWGIGLAPVLLGLTRRDALKAVVLAGTLTAAAWLPFLLADAGTLAATTYDNSLSAGSGLWALGVRDGFPPWTRYAQFAVAVAVGTAAALRGGWQAVPMTAGAARMLLEPRLFPHYPPGPVMGGLVFDLTGRHPAVPVWTVALWLCTKGQDALPLPDGVHGALLVAGTGTAIVVAVVWGRRLRAPNGTTQ